MGQPAVGALSRGGPRRDRGDGEGSPGVDRPGLAEAANTQIDAVSAASPLDAEGDEGPTLAGFSQVAPGVQQGTGRAQSSMGLRVFEFSFSRGLTTRGRRIPFPT